jgi:phytoene dehydrogenase-like protein
VHGPIIVGGGHNGLVCAAYLARAGLEPLVLERRDRIGGASVTEQPWPGYHVSTLAYVSSLLLPEVVGELEMQRHGYHVWEMQPDYFVPFPDGRSILLWSEAERNVEEFAKFSAKDAAAYGRFDEALSRMALLARRALVMTPPKIGSRRPRDLMALARTVWAFRSLGIDEVGELSRLMGRSIADLLDEYFESEQVKAALVSGGSRGARRCPCHNTSRPRRHGSCIVLAGDLDDRVLWIVEVDIEEDAGALPNQPVLVEGDEEPTGEDLGVGANVLGREQFARIGMREGRKFQSLTLLG